MGWQQLGNGVSVKISLDRADLGKEFVRASSDDQAAFLETFSEGLRSFGGPADDMQLQYVADWINNPENMFAVRDIRWLLDGLLERLDSP